MTIWVDADACPRDVRDVLCNAAVRRQVPIYFVANSFLSLPRSPYILSIQVEKGFDVADNKIVQSCEANDLVITGDIPLAAEILEKCPSASVINPYGQEYDLANIRQRLAMRDLMQSLRDDYGVQTSGKPRYANKQLKAFSDALDRYLTKHK